MTSSFSFYCHKIFFLPFLIPFFELWVFAEFFLSYPSSTSEDESKGIDGYIGSCSISVKPTTYKEKERIFREYPSGDLLSSIKGSTVANASCKERLLVSLSHNDISGE
jgi:hypothetical protein